MGLNEACGGDTERPLVSIRRCSLIVVFIGLWVSQTSVAQLDSKAASRRSPNASSESEVAKSRRGPATVDFRAGSRPAEAARETAADQKRETQIDAAKRLVPRLQEGSPQKAELLFQLAELYWERTRFLYTKEMRAFFDAQQTADEARAANTVVTEPKEDHRQSGLYRAETQRLYETILREHPSYERQDEVLFNLADTLSESDRKAEAAERYEALLKSHPKSKFVADTHVNLGNYYFDIANQLEKARTNYEKAYASSSARIRSYALYKLAWCDFNRGDHQEALKKLQRTVELADAQESSSEWAKAFRDLKTEALQDMVRVYVELNRTDEAVAYFKAKAEPKRRNLLTARLGFALFESGRFEPAVAAFRAVLKDEPLAAGAPEYQQAIVQSFEALRQRDQVRLEVAKMADYYLTERPWWKANASNRAALRNGFQVAEEVMRKTVTEYHQEAQKTKLPATYQLARDIYRQYVEGFASSADEAFISDQAFNLKFYYAEILWALDDWESAATQYLGVAQFKIPKNAEAQSLAVEKYRQTAAYNAILSYEKLVKRERSAPSAQTNQPASPSQVVDEKKKKGVVEKTARLQKRSVKELEEKPLTPFEAALVKACDLYNVSFPKNADEVDIAYQAAVILYEKNHFVEAASRFGEIIDKHPEDKRSQESADLSMSVLEEKGEWLSLNQLASKLKANARLVKPGSEFAKRVQSIVEGSQYKYADEVLYQKEKNGTKAAEAFEAFAEAYPRSENADRALTFSMQIAIDSRQLARAQSLGERVLKVYPQTIFDLKVKYALASIAERRAEYEDAARRYQAFLSSYDLATGTRPLVTVKSKGALRKTGSRPLNEPAANPVVSIALAAIGDEVKRKEREFQIAQCVLPQDNWVQNAAYNIGYWFNAVGQFEQAAAAYGAYRTRFAGQKDLAAIALAQGLALKSHADYAGAAKLFGSLAAEVGKGAPADELTRLEAKEQQLQCAEQLKNATEVERVARESIQWLGKLPQLPQTVNQRQALAAHARFALQELPFARYQEQKFKRVATFKSERLLKEKKLLELEKEYTAIVQLGEPAYAVASVTRIGMLYADFASSIAALPDPPGLDENQLALFRGEVESRYVFPVEEKAAEAFEKALQKASELHLYNEWTLLAQERLNQFRPSRFQPAKVVAPRVSEPIAEVRLDAEIQSSAQKASRP